MTKRIIGLILAIAAIAVIVIAAIRHNTYTSMIGPAATEMPAPEKTGQKKPAPETLRPDSYEGENETYIEASVENSGSILYDKEIRNKPRTRRTKRNV